MKKLKTVLAIIASILVVSVIIYLIPSESILSSLPFISNLYKNTVLEVISINGKAKVSINEKDYGETPLTINDLTPGDYTITLERVSDTQDFYHKQTFSVKLTRNTTSRVEVEIGPSGTLHGSILYYTPQSMISSTQGTLSVLCDTDNAKVYIDNEYTKQTPLISQTLTAKEYELKISADNYESLTIPVLIEKGYLLNVKIFLFPIPVNFEG